MRIRFPAISPYGSGPPHRNRYFPGLFQRPVRTRLRIKGLGKRSENYS
jgi:hypothetical protein